MSSTSFALLMLGVVLNAVAQLMLKAGANHIGPIDMHLQSLSIVARGFVSAPIIGGLACYVVSVVVWIIALTRVEVSVAYPMLSVGYVLNAIAAWALFGEALTPMRWTGILVIIAGVYIVAWSGRAA
jgi:multidrug transporter EmrE-like cation transporter